MRTPAHGRGSLRVGNTGGNPGTGRPPSAIRENLRGSFAERVKVIEDIADGVPIQRISVPLIAVLPHVVCPTCSAKGLVAKDLSELLTVSFDALASASPKDRLSALDLQAKYGLGALKEVSVENVRERVGKTLDVIRSHVPNELATSIVNALRPIWV